MSNAYNLPQLPTQHAFIPGCISVEIMATTSSNASITPPRLSQSTPRVEHSRDPSPVHDPDLAILPANHIDDQTQYESTSDENKFQSSLSIVQRQATNETLRAGPAYDELLEVAFSYPTYDRQFSFKGWKVFDSQGRFRQPWKSVKELMLRVEQRKDEIKLQQATEKDSSPTSSSQTLRGLPNALRNQPSKSPKASRQPKATQCLNCQLDSDYGDARPKRGCSSCAKLSASTPSKAEKKYGIQPNKRLKTSHNTKQDYSGEYAPISDAPVSEDQRPSRRKRSAGPDPPSPKPTSSNSENGMLLPAPEATQPTQRAPQPKLRINVNKSNPSSAIPSPGGTAEGIGSEITRSKSRTRAKSIIPLATQHHRDSPQTFQVCNTPECTCALTRHSSQTITCSDHACSTHLFNAASLQRMYSTRLLEDAQDQLSKTGSWSCPECILKSKRLQAELVSAGAYSIQSPVHGDSFLSQDEIRRPLNELSGKISQYIKMAFTQPSPYPLIPFTEIPCVRHESLTEPVVPVLRRLLNLGDGVLIRARIEGLQIGPEESAIWIKGVLMLLVCDFIFDSGSPFEDASELIDGLSHLVPSNLLDMIIQDSRIRAMNKKPENAQHFTQCRKARHDDFVKQLNSTMHSLVGCNDETKRFHSEIARIATGLNEMIFAYRAQGIHESIVAKPGDAFDPDYHELDSPELEGAILNQRDLAGMPILLTTIVGVKFKAKGQDGWAVCSPAKVRLWRNAMSKNQSTSIPKAILPPKKGKS